MKNAARANLKLNCAEVGIYAEEDKGSLHVQRVQEAVRAAWQCWSWDSNFLGLAFASCVFFE